MWSLGYWFRAISCYIKIAIYESLCYLAAEWNYPSVPIPSWKSMMKFRISRYNYRTREENKQNVTLNLLKLRWKSQSIIKNDPSFTAAVTPGTVHFVNYSLALNRTLTNAVQMSSQRTLNSSRPIEEYVLKSTKSPLVLSDNGFWLLN